MDGAPRGGPPSEHKEEMESSVMVRSLRRFRALVGAVLTEPPVIVAAPVSDARAQLDAD